MRILPIFWLIWALAFAIMETIALYNDIPNDTLTGTITSHIPPWLTSMGLGWLAYHFVVSYLNSKAER